MPSAERSARAFSSSPGRRPLYLAPVIGAEATALVVVRDPREAILPASGGWRSVLGPFPELDEVPEEAGSEAERDRWVDRIRQATRARSGSFAPPTSAGITREVAAALALGPRVAERAAVAAMEVGGEADVSRHRVGPPQWLDEVLYALGMPPKQRRPKERRQPAAAEEPARALRQEGSEERRRSAAASAVGDLRPKQRRPRKPRPK